MERKISQKQYKRHVQTVLLLVIAAAVALLVFFWAVQQAVEANVKQSVCRNVENQNKYFQMTLDIQYSYLEAAAGKVGLSKQLFSEDNMDLIRSITECTELDRVAIIDSSGESHYDNGEVKSVKERRYFAEGMAGSRTISDPLESKVSGQTRVILGVPIWKDGKTGGEVIGILGGSYDVSTLSQLLFGDIYGGKGNPFLAAKDGKIIAYGEESMESLKDKDNLFDFYSEMYGDTRAIVQMRRDFAAGKSGFLQIKKRTSIRNVAYEPFGYNGWMICYGVSSEDAEKDYRFISHYEMILLIVMVGLVLCMIFSFVNVNGVRQKELIKLASTDALTELHSKKSTEDQIQKWLSPENEALKGIQAFLIMDVDYFKEVNDNYGHTVGDEVLRQIGGCIKKVFRSTDIMGRIGGDEFAVFIKNVGSVENVEHKAVELAERIRQMTVPELADQRITCSIGVACYPKHGRTYLELFKHADMALYETKDRGRNG